MAIVIKEEQAEALGGVFDMESGPSGTKLLVAIVLAPVVLEHDSGTGSG